MGFSSLFELDLSNSSAFNEKKLLHVILLSITIEEKDVGFLELFSRRLLFYSAIIL